MKKLMLLALGVAVTILIGCDKKGWATCENIRITSQPFGGYMVDFMDCQFEATFTPERDPEGDAGWEAAPVELNWMTPHGSVKDTTFRFPGPGIYTQSAFLYAPTGQYLSGTYWVTVEAGARATSDTVECW